MMIVVVLLILGYGVFATKEFQAGDFLLEYAGDLVDAAVADRIADQTFVYYFSWKSKKYRLVYCALWCVMP